MKKQIENEKHIEIKKKTFHTIRRMNWKPGEDVPWISLPPMVQIMHARCFKMVLGYPNVNNKSEGSTYYPEKKAGILRLRCVSNTNANMAPRMLPCYMCPTVRWKMHENANKENKQENPFLSHSYIFLAFVL